MRVSIHSFLLSFVFQVVHTTSVSSVLEIATRGENLDDELDQWLTAAKRVSPDALKACPSSCHAASTKNGKSAGKTRM